MEGLSLFLDDLRRGQIRRALTENRVFRAWFRTGYPSTPRQQALIMFNNVFLHLHPVRIRRESLRITYTFCLGGLSFFLFLLLTITGVLLTIAAASTSLDLWVYRRRMRQIGPVAGFAL